MKLLEDFQGFVNRYYSIEEQSEQAGQSDKAFVLVSGATDPAILTEDGASKTGMKKNTKYKLEINGINDMIAIGETGTLTPNKTLKEEGKTSKPNLDYIKLTVDGKDYTINDKGRIDLDFGPTTKILVEGSENGLLALTRAMSSIYDFISETKFPKEQGFKGKMVLELKKERSSIYLSAIYDQKNIADRISTGYSNAVDMWDKKNPVKESKLNEAEEKAKADSNSVAAYSIADAIKACQVIAAGSQYPNRHSAFLGVHEIKKKMLEDGWEEAKPKNKEERISLGANLLSYAIHYILDSTQVLLDNSKIFKNDIFKECEEIIKNQPLIGDNPVQISSQNAEKYDKSSIQEGVKKILEKFTPQTVQNGDYKIFKPHLLEYYKFFTDCMVENVVKKMPYSGSIVLQAYTVGASSEQTQNIKSKKTSYKPGSAKN